MSQYDLHSLNLPKLAGRPLKLFTAALENPASRALLIGTLLENGGIPKLRKIKIDEPPTYFPLVAPDSAEIQPPEPYQPDTTPPRDFPYRTIRDYAEAFRNGTLDPVEVAEKALAAVQASEDQTPALRTFAAINREDVLAQAKASSERIRAGRPLSLLDGVPIGVKDEIDMRPYPTTVGTRFLGKEPAKQDSTVADCLRSSGALLVGKTNMHEIGINPNGYNDRYGAVRNPFDPNCDTGGSSSGSAASVSAGLVPAAIGADGGGSIRIPAALCGVVGLKPTYGRVSEFGAAPLDWSIAHLGPLAASVEDAAIVYAAIAGPDSKDSNSQVQPPVTLAGWNIPHLRGVRLGIYRPWFEHASAEVVQVCRELLQELQRAGAEVQEIEIPGLDDMRVAHAVTILSEMVAGMQPYREHRQEHAPAVRLSLILGEEISAYEFLQAQRIRTRALETFRKVYQQVDAIITPATALAAQPFPSGGLDGGWSDLGTETEMMRFVVPGNFLGLPAISFPAGYESRGLPVGMQAMGRHWEENLLLRVAYNAERVVKRRTPQRYHPVF